MDDKQKTPLDPPSTHPGIEGVGMEGFALANLREKHHLNALVQAVDSGTIAANVSCPYGLSPIATALRGWHLWRGLEDKQDPDAMEGPLARFHPGKAWDGTGSLYASERLVAALFRAGATLFPEGSEEKQFENLATAIQEDSPATATSLLHAPQCPDLRQSPYASVLLSKALEDGQSQVIRLMLDKGVDPNRPVKALMGKVRPAWFSVQDPMHLEWLLQAGADPLASSGEGEMAQEVWAQSSNIVSGSLKKMGSILSEWIASSPGVGGPTEKSLGVRGAFASASSLRIGAIREWIAQDAGVLASKQPVPGMDGAQEETLAQKVVRTYLFQKVFGEFNRASGNSRPPALGVLKLFLENRHTQDKDKGLVALTALAMGTGLAVKEVAASQAWHSMKETVGQILQSPSTLDEAWRELGHVFRRVSQGATFEGSPSSTKAFRISPYGPDDPRREEAVHEKISEILEALRVSPSLQGKKMSSPALMARMFAAWAPAYSGRYDRRLAHHLARHLDSSSQLCMHMRNAAFILEHDKQAALDFMRQMGQDPELFLGALVSIVLCGSDKDLLEPLQDPIRRLERALPASDQSPFVDTARLVLERASEKNMLHPDMARFQAQWRERSMDKQLPAPSASRPSPSIKSRF